MNHRYFALECGVNELEKFMRLFRDLNGLGANFTVPHKESIREHVPTQSGAVEKVGAANTLHWSGDELALENTDVYGFKKLVDPWRSLIKSEPVLLLGAGGAARACLVALEDLGVPEIHLWNRTREKAEALADDFSSVPINILSDRSLESADFEFQLAINATSLGLEEGDPSPLPEVAVHPELIGVDLIYGRETQFIRSIRKNGSEATDGMNMLIHQAARAWKLWTGREPQIDAMKSAVKSKVS